MTADLSLDADERMLCDAVTKLCAQRLDERLLKQPVLELDLTLWRALCAEGYFALGTSLSDGGARLVVACVEALGQAHFPGPIAETFLAAQVLDGRERDAVLDGSLVVSAGVPPALPFGDVAGLYLGLVDDSVVRLSPKGKVQRVLGLGAEPWGRAEFASLGVLPFAARGLFFFDLTLSTYLSSAARSLLRATVSHVATRKQFGRSLGAFQAVAHPLADLHIALASAQALARAAAAAFDEDTGEARLLMDAALNSAHRAALDTAYVCHQKLGAIGITVEGPAHHVTRKLRELATRAAQRSEQRGHTLLLSQELP